MTDYYTAYTVNRTVAGGKGQAPTSIVIGFYKGFIQPVSSNETWMQGKSAENASHRLYTALTTDINKEDKVTQGTQSYVVIADVTQPKGVSGVDHHREILLGIVK